MATAAATIAICSGVARVLYWPIDDSPSCAWSSEVSKVDRATGKGTRSAGLLKPKACAVVVMSVAPTATPSLANTVLQESVKASRTEAFRQPRDAFVRRVRVPGRVYGSGESVGASRSLTTPASSAAARVTTLKVEPGGYVRRIARLSIGRSRSAFSRRHASVAADPFPDSGWGS